MEKKTTLAEALEAVQKDGIALKDLPDELKTEEVCLAAARENGYALAFMPEETRTPAVCIEALLENGWAIAFVPEALRERVPEFDELAERRMLEQVDEVYPPERNRYYMERSPNGPVIRKYSDEDMEVLRREYEALMDDEER